MAPSFYLAWCEIAPMKDLIELRAVKDYMSEC